MVINEQKPKDNIPDENSMKAKILSELSEVDDSILALAYMYAKGFSLSGDDVTKAWVNAIQNTKILEAAYIKGYQEGKDTKTKDE